MKIIALHDIHYGFNSIASRKIHERFLDLLVEKIVIHNIQALIIAGDLIASRQNELEALLKLYRSKIAIPILIVFGNHDYWDAKPPYPLKRPRSYEEIKDLHDSLLLKYDVKYLENESVIINNVLFAGYDGWYKDVNPNTLDIERNGSYRMRPFVNTAPTHSYHNYRAHKNVERLLDEAERHQDMVRVCSSHFDCVPGWSFHKNHRGDENHLNALSEVYDFIFYGHTHTALDLQEKSARVMCAGGDYDHPIGIVVDIPNDRNQLDPSKTAIVETFKLPFTKRYKW